jgi:HK97 family phage major capsid protein
LSQLEERTVEKMLIRLTQDCPVHDEPYTKNTQLKVDKDTALELISEGKAVDYEAELKEQKAVEVVKAAVAEVIQEQKKLEADAAPDLNQVEVKKPEFDPLGGYGGQPHEVTKGHIDFAAGKCLKDIATAGRTGVIPDPLSKMQDAYHEAGVGVIKAAGTGQTAYQDDFGGFLLPVAVNNNMLEGALENAIVRPRAMNLPMDTQMVKINLINDNTHSSMAVFGNVTAGFVEETGTLAADQVKFEQAQLTLHKLTALGFVTEEQLRWSPVAMGALLIDSFKKAIAWTEDAAFIGGGSGSGAGTGAGQPMGLINANAAISVPKETSPAQSADTILFENIIKMYARVKVASEAGLVWITNRTTFPQLAQMSIDVGTGGSAVWLPASGVAGRPNNTLMGLPLLFSEKCPVVGDVGDIILTDLSQYVVGNDSRGDAVAESIHVKFENAQNAYRVLRFVDGQPLRRVAHTPLNGDTLSSIVLLAERA